MEDKWGVWRTSRIAKTINRSEGAVIRYAERNNLGGAYTGMYLSTQQVADLFNIDPTTVTRYWVSKYGLKASTQPLRKRKLTRILQSDLLVWCEQNQDKWRATNLPRFSLGEESDWLIIKREQDKKLQSKSGTAWTVLELNKLKELVREGKTSREISIILDRSLASIRGRRQRILDEIKQFG